MVPYYERFGVSIYHGDCLDVLPTLGPVSAVVTDPPYNVRMEDISHEGRTWKRDFGEWDEGWSPAPMLAEVMKILAPGGSVLSFTSDRILSAYRTAEGWKPRGTIIWEKLNPAPTPRPGYVNATEWIVWLQKPGAAAVWNSNGYTLNILRYPICTGSIDERRYAHPTQKPEKLIRELIIRHTNAGDVVLDPYMGSGTTLLSAKYTGRKAVGIEKEEQYCEIAAKRIDQSETLFDND